DPGVRAPLRRGRRSIRRGAARSASGAAPARPGRRLLPDAATLRKERRQLEALRHGVRRATRRGGAAASATGVSDHPSTSPPLPPAGHTMSLVPLLQPAKKPERPPCLATSASPSTVSESATSLGSRIADASQETGSAGSSTLNPSMQLNP
uniref:Uncharacterized protein n=1 Tax=Triticum urartu TaxID=4572 RepID=A0A8R7QPU8_TRIUA